MSAIRTTCPYCGVGCGITVATDGAVSGDKAHPANFGRICSKGAALDVTFDDGRRLLRPTVNRVETDWHDALDHVAAKFKATIAEHGPDAVAFYVSGQFLTEDYYVANKLMKGFIGSANIDTNSRLCMASTVAGHIRAFGADVVPGVYEDWEEADLVVLVGSNTAWCHPVLFQRLAAARARHGTRIVVVDPRRTASCEIADLHLPLAMGSDVALFAGLLANLADRGTIDRAWIDAHTDGFALAMDAAQKSFATIDQVARVTNLPVDAITTFFDWFAATERTVTVFSQGVNQSAAGTDKVNAIINCHLATGRIGRPGMGPFSATGQPNAMGGREVGGLANQSAAHMQFGASDLDRLRRFWQAPNLATRPGLKAVDLFDAVDDGRVKAVWIAATNPAASMPRAGRVRRALEKCPFVVVSDCWPTDTTALAHVVLPAAGWGEKEGTVTNSERCISRQRGFRPIPGEAKPDWWMYAQIAARMGWSEAFSYRSAADVFREHAALSGFENHGTRAFDIGGLARLTDSDYAAMPPTRWPVRAGQETKASRLFADGRFFTPSGRASFVATTFRPVAENTDRKRSFLLNTGRIRDQWHTMTRTGHAPRLMMHQDQPFLDLCPSDAMKLGVADGDIIRIETDHGEAVLPVRASAAQRPGEAFVPMHWSAQFLASGPVLRLVGAACDPISGQPELKATAAKLSPVPTLWRGLMVGRRRPAQVEGLYGATVPIEGGWACTLRGWDPLPPIHAIDTFARTLLAPLPKSDWIERVDDAQSNFRFASMTDGRLESCLILATPSAAPPPDTNMMAALLGASFDDANVLLSAPVAAPVRAASNRSICSCFAVSRADIEQVIRDKRITSVGAIGVAVKAGTNCGSCIPELEEILRETAQANPRFTEHAATRTPEAAAT
ncbi:MAG: nitrate reductase [Rhodospirillaceae bacterium]|nr:MAG: nitrate reductase [Rhodospirillaceae bacterium]